MQDEYQFIHCLINFAKETFYIRLQSGELASIDRAGRETESNRQRWA